MLFPILCYRVETNDACHMIAPCCGYHMTWLEKKMKNNVFRILNCVIISYVNKITETRQLTGNVNIQIKKELEIVK